MPPQARHPSPSLAQDAHPRKACARDPRNRCVTAGWPCRWFQDARGRAQILRMARHSQRGGEAAGAPAAAIVGHSPPVGCLGHETRAAQAAGTNSPPATCHRTRSACRCHGGRVARSVPPAWHTGGSARPTVRADRGAGGQAGWTVRAAPGSDRPSSSAARTQRRSAPRQADPEHSSPAGGRAWRGWKTRRPAPMRASHLHRVPTQRKPPRPVHIV